MDFGEMEDCSKEIIAILAKSKGSINHYDKEFHCSC